MFAAATILRGQATVNVGTIAGASRADNTVAFTGAALGDKPIISPAAVNASASVIVVASPVVTTAGIITVSTANLSSATVAAGTAIVYNISVIKNVGASNT